MPDRLSRVWEREIGEGYSGPVVSGDRVWVESRQGDKEVVRSLRLADGKVLWGQSYEAAFRQDDSARAHGLGPYSTPALADGRLFTFSVNAVLRAWDANTGALLWKKASSDEFDPSFPFFGAAASPLVWRDLCIVHLGGHERDDIDAPSVGAMVALNVSDGREMWRWSGDGPALAASPVIHQLEGGPHLVFKTKKLIVGLDPLTGKELWRRPFRVPMDNTIVTPLLTGTMLLTSDYDTGILAWQIVPNGESWDVRPLWKHREVSLFMSSPVVAGDLVVGFSHFRRGQLFVLDPENGEVLWRGEPRSGEHATVIAWGSQVLVIQEDGMLLLAEVSRSGLVPIRKYGLGESVAWSHPAVVGDRLVFRDGSRLAVVRLK
ncbi:MAG: PQQ-binding-like beta-propeller repeat protein [bacterium]|nr:PQQ-binding-like beta-propeller repeat protein [bacterium]